MEPIALGGGFPVPFLQVTGLRENPVYASSPD
jgi:hypothetical protein